MDKVDEVIVELICVKDKNKLRVRIQSDGYLKNANCQFPRELRVEGRKFHVSSNRIQLMNQRGKYFYSVRKKEYITIVDDNVDYSGLKIFEDESSSECLVCFEREKSKVFNPCGHYYCCNECSLKCQTCPVCRAKIISCIDRSLIQ